ncbi:MAG: hypothetical protein JW712_10980 [Dehalococcoidales bacterium]|nr:hypothetical protein [Dehalococcoidales bacterium]
MEDSENIKETRQERRERKLTSKHEQVKKHNKNIARLYKEAIMKRINKMRSDKGKRQEEGE